MTLTDAGPLVALIDADEGRHKASVDALATLARPLVTTLPAFTEAMYLLGRVLGWTGQDALWRIAARHDLEVADLDDALLTRCRDLMWRYRDHPMDLADASLVAVAEARTLGRIFTFDADFRTYRLAGGRVLEVVP